ncbi:MAG: FkbM family methyltransferase [Candidatus Hydrogenedentes bacterium]|nr:FkbM family methyltransferase [Candidatus Hydrogenedentota bacterium]
MSARDSLQLVQSALTNPESIGCIANDYIAMVLVTRLCRAGQVFVDVGAHIGIMIDAVQHHDPSVEIIAVEAIPEKVANLRRKFPRITLHECAVGEVPGEASFFINLEQTGYSSLSDVTGSSANKEIRVKVATLDDLLGAKKIDVIKIDVEGAELGVFRGAQAVLSHSRPFMMFESGPDERLGYTKTALWQFLHDHDYAVLAPNAVAHNHDGLGLEGFLESHVYPRRATNFFAIPRERRIEARDRAREILKIVVT